MALEKKFYFLVFLIIAAIYVLDWIDFNSLFNFTLDFGLVLAIALLLMGLIAGFFYAKSGDWNFFWAGAALLLIGLISFLNLFGELTVGMGAIMGWGIIIFLFVWRGTKKSQG